MYNTYTSEAKKPHSAPKAPLYCGLINPPAAAKDLGVTSRQIISVVGIYNRDTNGFEVRTIFGTTDFSTVVERQAEEKKKRFGEAFDGNYLYDRAQQGFFSCMGNLQSNQIWAALYCWMDCVDTGKGAAKFVYQHNFVAASPNGFFDINNPLMHWENPKDIPLTLENAKSDTFQKVLNNFYPDEEEPIWKISSWHPSVQKKLEEKAKRASSVEASVFGIAPREQKPIIRNAETRLDNRTKQIINNLLRRELGMEVFVDKEGGGLAIRECRQKPARRHQETDMEHAFMHAATA